MAPRELHPSIKRTKQQTKVKKKSRVRCRYPPGRTRAGRQLQVCECCTMCLHIANTAACLPAPSYLPVTCFLHSLFRKLDSGAARADGAGGDPRAFLHRSEFNRCRSAGADEDDSLPPRSPVVVAADEAEEREPRALSSSSGSKAPGPAPAGMCMW